jgi:hypothetical protein
MTAMLIRTVQALSGRAGGPMTDGCPPDCQYETRCLNHRLYRRQCCTQPDCTVVCGDWVDIDAC